MSEEIKILRPDNILDYVDTMEHLQELFNYIINLQNKYENQINRYINLKEYITKLQKENEELRNNQKYHKNNVFSLEYDKETLVQMCNDLQEENERLGTVLNLYKSCENANEYLKFL